MNFAKVSARAHTNIALIKYWGKKDDALIIPQNNSLSLTLDHFYTDTSVLFDPDLTHDTFTLNNVSQDATNVSAFLNIVRQKAGIPYFAHVNSTNHVPTTAGLASSASAYAALALAASHAANLSLNKTELSRLARRGSGSACRSIFGGFVEWFAGTDDQSSYAAPVPINVDWDICMIAIVVDKRHKKISSRAGMQRVVATSPYYSAWIKQSYADLDAIKAAMNANDFATFGQIAQENALKMHALNLSAHPAFSYFEPESIVAMNLVEELQQQNIACYYTMDAGANVKVICQQQDVAKILAHLSQHFTADQLLVAKSGPAAHLLSN